MIKIDLYGKLNKLDSYILKQVLEVFIMGIVIFTSIIFASDTFITLVKQITAYGIPFNIALMIVLLSIPQVIVMAIPMSVLFSTVMTLNRLSLSSEITVMRSCGIGLNRIAKPIFIFAAAMALLTFAINEMVVPVTNSQSKILAVWALGQKNIPNGKQNFTFKDSKDGMIKRLFYVDKCEENTLKNVSVVDFSEPGDIRIIQAQSGKTSPAGWLFKRGAVYSINLEGKMLNTTWFSESLADFGLDVKDKLTEDEAQQYNIIALWKYIEKNKKIKKQNIELGKIPIAKQNKKTTEELTEESPEERAAREAEQQNALFKIELYNKFAFPVTTIVLVLLGVPLAITPPRVRYNRGFLFSILILFLYYLLRGTSISLGETMTILPFLAAWIPNIVLAALGGWLYYRKVYTIT